MRYFRTKYGTIINENNVVIPMQEGNALWLAYVDFLKNEGIVEDTDFLTDFDLEIENNEKPISLIDRIAQLENELNEIKSQL